MAAARKADDGARNTCVIAILATICTSSFSGQRCRRFVGATNNPNEASPGRQRLLHRSPRPRKVEGTPVGRCRQQRQGLLRVRFHQCLPLACRRIRSRGLFPGTWATTKRITIASTAAAITICTRRSIIIFASATDVRSIKRSWPPRFEFTQDRQAATLNRTPQDTRSSSNAWFSPAHQRAKRPCG